MKIFYYYILILFLSLGIFSCWYAPPTRSDDNLNNRPSIKTIIAGDGRTIQVTFSESIRILDGSLISVHSAADRGTLDTGGIENIITGLWVNGSSIFLTLTNNLVRREFVQVDIQADMVESISGNRFRNTAHSEVIRIVKDTPALLKMSVIENTSTILVWMSEIVTVATFNRVNFIINKGDTQDPLPNTPYAANGATLATEDDGILAGEVGYVVKITGRDIDPFLKDTYVSLTLQEGVVSDSANNTSDEIMDIVPETNLVKVLATPPKCIELSPDDGKSLRIEVNTTIVKIDISKIFVKTNDSTNKVIDGIYTYDIDITDGTYTHYLLLSVSNVIEDTHSVSLYAEEGAFVDSMGTTNKSILQPITTTSVAAAPSPIAAYIVSPSSNTLYVVFDEKISLTTRGVSPANWRYSNIHSLSTVQLEPKGYVIVFTLIDSVSVGDQFQFIPEANLVEDYAETPAGNNGGRTIRIGAFSGFQVIK